jgi:hypothetical protein
MKHEQKILKKQIKKANLALNTLLDSQPRDMVKVKNLIAHIGQLNNQLSKLINPRDTGPEFWKFNPALVDIHQKYARLQK